MDHMLEVAQSRSPRAHPRLSHLCALIAATCAVLLLTLPASARDRGADGRFDRRRSAHFLLLQDVDIDQRTGSNGARRFERDMLEVLESAYAQVADQLGLRPRSDIEVRIYDPRVFDAQFASGFGFRAAGFFNGAIHVRGGTKVTPQLVRTLHHEYLHAALHSAAGARLIPAWLNEGTAEYFENLALGKASLSRGELGVLARLARANAWIPLAALSGPSFSHLQDRSASIAYLEAYALVDHLVRREGMRKFRRFYERLFRTRNLEISLRDTFGLRLQELESEVLSGLR